MSKNTAAGFLISTTLFIASCGPKQANTTLPESPSPSPRENPTLVVTPTSLQIETKSTEPYTYSDFSYSEPYFKYDGEVLTTHDQRFISALTMSALDIDYSLSSGISSELSQYLKNTISNNSQLDFKATYKAENVLGNKTFNVVFQIQASGEESALGYPNSRTQFYSYDPETNTVIIKAIINNDGVNPVDTQHLTTSMLQNLELFGLLYLSGIPTDKIPDYYKELIYHLYTSYEYGALALMNAFAVHQACLTANTTGVQTSYINQEVIDLHNKFIGNRPIDPNLYPKEFERWSKALHDYLMTLGHDPIGFTPYNFDPTSNSFGNRISPELLRQLNPQFDVHIEPDTRTARVDDIHSEILDRMSNEPLALKFDPNNIQT